MSDDYQGLVMDLGVSEGNDTAFYLAKGFRVIAVEADPATCLALRSRFAREIGCGALNLLNFAAGSRLGDHIIIYVHDEHQGISGIAKRADVTEAGYRQHIVQTIDWRTLVAQAGAPRYLKIDIEGNEGPFLDGLLQSEQRPEFVSVECHQFKPVEKLFEAGYRRFRLVDQNPPGGFRLPDRQREGLSIEWPSFVHATGPFGLDLFGDGAWTDIEQFRVDWQVARPHMAHTWFDCHAWRPN